MNIIKISENQKIPFKRHYCEVYVTCASCKRKILKFCYDIQTELYFDCPVCKSNMKVIFVKEEV